MKLATNAPAHWPLIHVDSWDNAKTWNNAEAVGGALDQGFVAAGTPCPILLYGSRLYEEGILEVPIQVTDKNRKYCVFLYPSEAAGAAGAFAAARQLVEADGTARAVYYCPVPLGDAAPGDPFGPFLTRYIARYQPGAPAGEYAMWWATPGDEVFAKSKTFELLEDFYRMCHGIETWVLGDFLQALGLMRGMARARMPDEGLKIAIYGPEERLLIFGASEKGLRLFFPVDSDPRYRDRLWRHVGDYALRLKSNLAGAGAPFDEDSQARGFPFWSTAVPALLKQVKDPREMKQFGPLHVLPETKG